MDNKKKYRYPGINSFESTDSDIFFGREDDRKKLADLIEIEKTVLLYSRSGLGKTSLIKAAVMPELSARGCQCFYLRLGPYKDDGPSPVQNILVKTVLSQEATLPDTFLKKFINRTNSLWYAFKTMQINQSLKDSPIILIFDQFEEIGSYPAGQFLEFKQQLSELLNATVPKSYLDGLKYKELLTEPLTDAEMDLLYKPLRIKIVFSIRSDQMSILNQLSDYFPNILKVFYELKPLNHQQGLHAIEDPAKKVGAFITPPFTYQGDAIDKLMKALASEKNSDIDTSQLQILLQYIEQDIVEKRNDTSLTADDLGDLNKVYENYYHNSILKLDSQQREAQELIEDKLIADKRRMSYDMALCLQLVHQATLDKLVETRLLRKEPNTTGGYSYELAHDTLVAPVLEARGRRILLEEEARQKSEYEYKLTEQAKKLRRKRSRLITVMLIIILILFGLVTFYKLRQSADELRQSTDAFRKERAFTLSIQSQNIENEDPTIALNLAYEAVKLHPDTIIVAKAFEILEHNIFYKNIVQVQPKSFISISRDGSKIITSSESGQDSLWDINGKLLNAFNGQAQLRAIDFSKDGTNLLMGLVNGDVLLCKVSGEIIKKISTEDSRITTALFSPDENTVLVRSEKTGQVKIMNTQGITASSFDNGFIICAVFSHDGKNVLTGSKDGVARLWDLQGNLVDSFGVWGGDIMSLSFLDEKRFLVGSWDGIVAEWNTETGAHKQADAHYNNDIAKFNNDDHVSAIAWSRNDTGFYVFTGTWDKSLINCWNRVQDKADGQPGYTKVAELKGQHGAAHNIVYDSTKKILYSCSNDCTAKKWTNKIRVETATSNQDKRNILEVFMKSNNIELLTPAQKKEYNIE